MEKHYELLLDDVIGLAHKAAEAILQVYASEDFDVQAKSDQSPLTLADQAAHSIILEGLQALTPQHPVLSEESAALPYAKRKQWHTYWLVDPLDGTKEFIKRNGEFTVNIALIEDHQPVLGVVYVPVSGVVYYAAKDAGAYKRQPDAGSQSIRVRPCPESGFKLVGSRSHANQALQDFITCLGTDTQVTSIGSALKICLVAEGAADIYPRLGLTSEWDTAAAQCVVEQAGGHLTGLDLHALRYNTKDSLLNPFFVVFAEVNNAWSRCLHRLHEQLESAESAETAD